MKLRATVTVLLLLIASASGGSAQGRPGIEVSSVSQEIAPWCLMSGFFYAPAFGPSTPGPNVDVQTVLLAPPNGIIATDGGQVVLDDCVGLGTVVQAYKQGARNVVVVAVTGIVPAYTLIGGKNIKRLGDFKGKTLASNGLQTTATQAVVDILRRGAHLLPDRDYTLVAAGNAGARAAALAAGKIDGVSTVAPFTYEMIDDGYPAVATERQYVPDYVQGTLVANRDWAQKNRPVMVAILRRMLEIGRWLHDPKQKNGVLAQLADDVTMGSKKIGADYARRMYAETVAVPGGVVDGGYADHALFERTYDLFVERGLIAKSDEPPLDKIVDFSYLNEARRELGMPQVPAP